MYNSDVSDEQWDLIAPFFAPLDPRGSTSTHAKRAIVNAIFYLNKTGAQWRLLPKEFPPWQTVYDHYRNWNRRGVWEQALDALNVLQRKKTAKTPPRVTPSSIRQA
jgi:putative transposase